VRKIIGFFIFFFSIIFPVFAVDYPNPSGFVNDYANLYSTEFKNNLENKLSEFEKTTTAEIAVVTIKSLEGESVEEYAVRLFEKWRIGKEKEDNGLLLLIAKDDREVRIEVGYGLEPLITDSRAGDIIRRDIIPEFKSSNYEAGTEKAINSLTAYIKGDSKTGETGRTEADWDKIGGWVVMLIILMMYLGSFLGRTKEIWPGGVIGAAAGLIGGLWINLLTAIFGVIVLGLFGLLLDYFLTAVYKYRKEHHQPTGWWQSGGGFWRGSGGGGGSFGGFGGGSSGGGGASGRW